MPWWYVPTLVNERHLIDFAQRCDPSTDLGQPAASEGNHTLFDGRSLDFRGGPAVHNHFANMIGQVQQFADCRSPVVAGPRAFQAARAFNKLITRDTGGIKGRFT